LKKWLKLLLDWNKKLLEELSFLNLRAFNVVNIDLSILEMLYFLIIVASLGSTKPKQGAHHHVQQ